MPAPETLFGSMQLAVGNATAMAKYVKEYGPRVTVREMIQAGTKMDFLVTSGAGLVAAYTGCVIGSIAVAAGRVLGNGTSLADVMYYATRADAQEPWLRDVVRKYPGIYQPNVACRSTYNLCSRS